LSTSKLIESTAVTLPYRLVSRSTLIISGVVPFSARSLRFQATPFHKSPLGQAVASIRQHCLLAKI
jgi:hypothetical protein